MAKTRLMPEGHWDWSMPVSFSQGWKVGNLIFVGGQVSLDRDAQVIAPGDIEAQTHNTFGFVRRVLEEGGGDLPDLVKFNTWYEFEGRGPALKDYWERMTRVRLQYLDDPGPVGTALRIAGLGYADLLIEIDGVAAVGGKKIRLMPNGHWDWSIPVPLSQGWTVDDLVFVGGQVSADEHGEALAAGDIAAQTRNTYGFIGKVLEAAGANFSDIVQLNVFYRYDGPADGAEDYVRQIHDVSGEFLTPPYPSGIISRVDGLAYEGLLIEIEAIASLDPGKTRLSPEGHWAWPGNAPFSQGWKTGDLVFVSGQISADSNGRIVGAGDIEAQTHNVFQNMRRVLNEAGADMGDLVKLYTFYHCDDVGAALKTYWERMTAVRMQYLPSPGPTGTAIRVNGFAPKGQMIEIEGIAAVKT
jgi:enamine deaminase RidA (YjgF/YER057c/UK114 family)